MITRLLYVTDTHIKGSTPASRTDDYFVTCLRKLGEVIEIAKQNEVSHILHGGDFFDSPRPGYGVLIPIMSLISREPSINWYLNVGNHDLFGWSAETIDRSAIRALTFLDNVYILGDQERYMIESNVALHSRWSAPGRDGDPNILTLQERNPDCYNIVLAHVMLVEDSFFGDHISISSLPLANLPDLILGSHYHPGWPVKKIQTTEKTTTLANPGSLLRPVKTAERREPAVLLIEISQDETNRAMKITKIPLQNIESWPFKQDSDVAKHENILYEPQFGTFLEQLTRGDVDTSIMDPRELTRLLGQELECPEEVITKALECLDHARKQRDQDNR